MWILRGWSRLVRSFVAVPAICGLIAFLLAIGALQIDIGNEGLSDLAAHILPPVNPDTARTLLSVIAGSMMTVLSLVYSLTLIVFTLAAGNIGPRLIERFTNDRTTQLTAGLLVGTFVYSVVVLSRIDTDFVPRSAALGSLLLTGITLVFLILFIRSVAERVSIDNEIGRVSAQLVAELRNIGVHEEAGDLSVDEFRGDGEDRDVKSRASGYITLLDVPLICEAARKTDGFVEMTIGLGDFVIGGQTVAKITGSDDPEKMAAVICDAITLERRRTSQSDAEFSVHLLVEIAMRALSPGVNDSYTAIACIDQLSAALALPLAGYSPPPLHEDSEGTPRLWLDGVATATLVGTALHPLRRSSSGNVTVTLRLVQAIDRLSIVAHPHHRATLRTHLELLRDDVSRSVPNQADREEVETAIASVLEKLDRD